MPKTAKNIYKRKDGRWEARYPTGKKENGSTKYASIYAKSYTEARKLLQEVQTKQINVIKKKVLFSSVLDEWMRINSLNKKAATKLKYAYLIENHIKPELGGYKIQEINELLVNDFLGKKLLTGRLDHTGGLSGTYVKTMYLIIQATINYGAEHELCHKFKTSIVKLPIENKEIVILTAEEQRKLETQLQMDSSPEGLGIMISLYTGLRIGEVCALRWADIDLHNRILHVKHTISRIKNQDANSTSKTMLVLDTPKTKSSTRDIPLTTKMYDILSKAAMNACSEFVVSVDSSFISPRTYEYRFHRKLEKYGIVQVNYHSLRHTFATRCIEKGIDAKTLSEILGHSNVSVTLNTYVHSSMTLKREQLEKLN